MTPGKYFGDWRNWVAPAAIAGTLVVALFLAFLVVMVLEAMGDKANEIDDTRAMSAAQTALTSVRRRLSGTLEDNAVWREAFIALQSQNRKEWMWTNWGSISADYQLYDGVAVTDPEGRLIASYFKGTEFDAVAAFGDTFVRQARAAAEPDKPPITNVFKIHESVAIVGSRALQPDRNMPPGGRYNVVTMFKLLTPAMVDSVASDYFLPDLHLAVTRPPGELSLPLTSIDGDTLAYLAWPGRNLGTRLYDEVRPALTGALVALGILLATAVFAGYAELQSLRRLALAADREATRDPLSGLLNRKGMIRALQAHLGNARESAGLTLHLIDLDGFKAVNDTWGHLVGDELIGAVAARLVTCHPRLEFAARFGGDEFALASRPGTDPAEVAEAVLLALKQPFHVAGHTTEVGASVGYATHAPEMDTFELIRRADMALYGAKEAGRGQCIAFTPEMDRDREVVAELEEQLRETLDRGELSVAFQPVVSSENGAVAGVEALARWSPPQGPVSPDVFIPLAEKSGLIFQLGQIVLERSISFAKARPGIDIAVNVSPTQLCSPDFADSVAATLAAEAFDPRRLILEVTEGVLFDSPLQARRAIDALRAMGIRFALDDFGTGYASIGTLNHFTFDRLKLDRSLVQGLDSERGRALLNATVSLAEALGIPVIVEGVETPEQAGHLRQLGCQFMQGYYFGKPMSAEDFDSLPGRMARAG
ncbi:putative bifunctional diguanylate cyclase/phosphodiesterase [Rhizobium sp. C4]|uniref:putative bifunctional diguanylate cyclase/phosphodiesterase n=1 Tax=Rhizobium sp. C4 TaxID=1349800 RepID=UPI001E4A257E|nr:EAL domain-containing protein [Rhizobium sp. C4]MCD2171876.1 EAL domain-containing protein [Rhizobium sp. C4]